MTFADAAAPRTTATFAEAGQYVLALTAGTPPLATSAQLTVHVAELPPDTRVGTAGGQTVPDPQSVVEPSREGADRQLDSPLHPDDLASPT